MTTTGFTQIFNNTSIPQATGRTHRQYPLNITSTSFTLCTETALTPQYSLTYNTLSKIIGWFHILIIYKCPKMPAMFKYPAAFATQRAFALCLLLKKFFHTRHQRRHSILESPPPQCSITNSSSHLQYLLCQTIKLVAYFAGLASGFADGLKITFQMCPAYLANQFIKIVGVITVTYQLARKAAHQFASRFLAGIGMNHKKRRCCTTESPQPAFLPITSGPAGFLSMTYILSSDILGSFIIWLLKYIGQLCLTIAQAPKAHRYREHLIEYRQRLAFTGIEKACQHANHRQCARTKMFTLKLIRQRLIDKLSAIFASIYMLNILCNFRLYGRYINYLMTQRFFVCLFNIYATARACLRFHFNTFCYFLRRQQVPHKRLVSVPCSTFFTPAVWQHGGHPGPIGGWRVGRI